MKPRHERQPDPLGKADPSTLRPTPYASGYAALAEVARTRGERGDLLGALEAYRCAARLAEQRRDDQWRGVLLSRMADLYRQEGAPPLALPLYQEALACFERCDDQARGRQALRRIMQLSGRAGDREAAPEASSQELRHSVPCVTPLRPPRAGGQRLAAAAAASTLFVASAAGAEGLRTSLNGLAAVPDPVGLPSTSQLPVEPSTGGGSVPWCRIQQDSSTAPAAVTPSDAGPPVAASPEDRSNEQSITSGSPVSPVRDQSAAGPPAPAPSPPAGQNGCDPTSQEQPASAGGAAAPPPDKGGPESETGGASSSPEAPRPAEASESTSTLPATAPSRPPAGHTRSLAVPRVRTPPVIDGRLDDPCWKAAARAVGFWVSETNHAPQDQTEVLVLADADTLYFGFRCHDSDPKAIFAQQKQRDAGFDFDDAVTVQLDPYHNYRQISEFSVNALGTQADAIAGGRASNIEWKGDWKGAAARAADGWTAELAIPFAILNYEAGADTFGVNFLRYQHRTQETSRWADVTPAICAEEIGRLTGLRPPAHSAPPLSLMTYTTGGVNTTDRAGRPRSFLAGTGLDLRYNVANNLTGMASLYPDFSQVEDQVVGLAFSYNEKLVADHRPFFQEGNGFFGRSRAYFYSGRIPNFDAGAKLFGRLGKMEVGLLGVTAPGGRQDYVARAVREFGPRTNVALMMVGSARSQVGNELLALQASTRSARGLTASLDLAGTHTQGQPGDGTNLNLSLGRETPYLQYGVSGFRTGPHFYPADGFIAGDQLGTQGGSAYVSYGREYGDRWIRTVEGDLAYSYRDTLAGLLQNRSISADFSLETHSQRQLTFSYSAGPYRPRAKDPGQWSKTVNQDRLFLTSLYFNTRSSRGGYGLSYAWGSQGGGRYSDLAPSFWWKPSAKTSLSYSYEQAFSFGTTRQSVLSFSCDLDRQQSIGLRWVDYQGQGYWRVAFRRAVTRGIDIYAVFNREPGISHRFVVKLVRSLR